MVIFLILAPFGAFAALTLVTSASTSLFTAAGIALATIVYDLSRGGSIKMLASGSVILFGALGCYVTFVDSGLGTPAVGRAGARGVLAISLLSIAIRFPFTLQYAREAVDVETAKLPGFKQTNYVITWVWTAAFVLMVIANVLMIYIPGLPLWAGIAIALLARNSATLFTRWYPKHRQQKAARQAISGAMISAT
jgi:hypothetical protein